MFMDKEVASYEETKQELLENESVSEIRLLGKPSDERNAFGVIITYKADQEFPTSIGVWGIRKRVSQYLPQPVQCFRCQRFGHRALECRGKERCMICAGAHSNKDCTSRGDMGTTKCINCGKNHTANSKECLIRQERALILKKAILEDLPVHEARKKIASTQLQLPPNFQDENAFPQLVSKNSFPSDTQENGINKQALATLSKMVEKQNELITKLSNIVTSLIMIIPTTTANKKKLKEIKKKMQEIKEESETEENSEEHDSDEAMENQDFNSKRKTSSESPPTMLPKTKSRRS